MNKWILYASTALAALSAQAQSQFYCNYKDFFHLSDNTHPEIYIVSGYSEQDILLQFVGPRSFILRDTSRCTSGYAHVTVAYDVAHWCVLDMKDGPYMNHPTIKTTCSNMKYLGTEYDGLGSYSYSINFG